MDKNQPDNIENTKEWEKIAKGLFRPLNPPVSEAFITRVMARLEDKEPTGIPAFLNWALPAASLLAAGVLLFALLTPPQNPLSLDDLFSANGAQTSSETAPLDDILNY